MTRVELCLLSADAERFTAIEIESVRGHSALAVSPKGVISKRQITNSLR